MLERLSIKHYALIEDAQIDFAAGLNALTGETGAGKSIILGALSLLLGDKADADVIRPGHDSATVSGSFVFDPVPSSLASVLSDMEIELEEGTLVLSRTVRSSGRSICQIQGVTHTRADLEKVGKFLVDISAQRDHQSLFLPQKQREVLDSAAKDDGERASYAAHWDKLKHLAAKEKELSEIIKSAQREHDWLSYAVGEIDKVRPKAGEDEAIGKELEVLGNYEEIRNNASLALSSLKDEGDVPGAVSALEAARNALKAAAEKDQTLAPLASRMESCAIECDDIAETLRDYTERMSFSQERLDKLQNRMAWLQRLKKKYGPTLEDVLKTRDDAKARLAAGESGSEELAKIRTDIEAEKKALIQAGGVLREKRKKEAARLGSRIETVLRSLGMADALFRISVLPQEPDASGMDSVSFDITANPGQPSRPIAQVASGGELSRIIVALKATLEENDETGTLVFDEIDSGIGGTVALKVRDLLLSLGKTHQVIYITHLATMAASASSHFRVEKKVVKGETFSSITPLSGDHRVEEIARMLSGDTSALSLMHARELLKN